MAVNCSIRLFVQYLAGPNAEPLSGFDCRCRVGIMGVSTYLLRNAFSICLRKSERRNAKHRRRFDFEGDGERETIVNCDVATANIPFFSAKGFFTLAELLLT